MVGAGRLGTALALALKKAGYSLQALVARRRARARKAQKLVGGRALALSEEHLGDLPESDLLIISTPDDAIPSVAAELSEAQRGMRRGRTALHTSGALSSEVLSPLAEAGFHTGSLHPLVSVSDAASGPASFRSAFFCLEGDRAALRVARSIVHDLGGRDFSVTAANKALYHAAAVMASGHIVALFDIAAELLTECGIDQANARRVLRPLIQSTAKSLLVSEPARALTGTFARGDLATVRKHLSALAKPDRSEALKIYQLLAYRALKLAAKNGLDAVLSERIAAALDFRASQKD